MPSEQEQYNELSYYTLAHSDPSFIHQHIVDAYTAQTATEDTKPIAIIFALAGLYLYIERDFTGKQVQNMHMQMANNKVDWPPVHLPELRGKIIVGSVLSTLPGKSRDIMIQQWCASVWKAYEDNHETIITLLQKYLS